MSNQFSLTPRELDRLLTALGKAAGAPERNLAFSQRRWNDFCRWHRQKSGYEEMSPDDQRYFDAAAAICAELLDFRPSPPDEMHRRIIDIVIFLSGLKERDILPESVRKDAAEITRRLKTIYDAYVISYMAEGNWPLW